MGKVLMALSVLCLAGGVMTLFCGVGLWPDMMPPVWFWIMMALTWGSAIACGGLAMVVDE